MASICGISVKNLKNFLGHEGETLFQGNVYLNGKKIGFWSQDSHGGPDNFMLDGGYRQEKVLNDAVSAAFPEKGLRGEANGESYVIAYDLGMLMVDLIDLMEDEKAYKAAVKKGFAGILVATDGYHQTTWSLPEAYVKLTDAALLEALAGDIQAAKEDFYPEDKYREHQLKIYRSLDDFVVGGPISLQERQIERVLKDAKVRGGVSSEETSKDSMEHLLD